MIAARMHGGTSWRIVTGVRNSILVLLCALVLAACAPKTTAQWEDKLIQGPGTSPDATKVYLVRDGKRHWVTHAKWLVAHGYKWPQDVNHVSADDLNAIPLADPINDPG